MRLLNLLFVSLPSLICLHLMVGNFSCYGVAVSLYTVVALAAIVDCSLGVAELIFLFLLLFGMCCLEYTFFLYCCCIVL